MNVRSHPHAFSARALVLAIAVSAVNVGGVVLLFGWSDPASAASADAGPATACPVLSARQRHILDSASQGVDALRDYLWVTRGIEQLDLAETVRWIETHRTAAASCGSRGE